MTSPRKDLINATKSDGCLHVLLRCVMAGLWLVTVTNVGAQPVFAVNDVTSHLWRSITFSQGRTLRTYSEPDPLIRVSSLDSEAGNIPVSEVAFRWRGQLSAGSPELVTQASASYLRGQTAYSGYLQRGNTLEPYQAITGNTLRTVRLRIGMPLSALTQHAMARHIAPYVEQSWEYWQRNLTQYGETFNWRTSSLGVLGIWPLSELAQPHLERFALEADVTFGRTRSPNVFAPTLNFAADLGETNSQSAALGLHYSVTPMWSLGLRYTIYRNSFGASASGGELQFPGADYHNQSLTASVGTQF